MPERFRIAPTVRALAFACALTSTARAQETAPAEPAAPPATPEKQAVVEEITVTGSRVRRKDLTTPAPVTVIAKEQIIQSGKVTIGDFLQGIPEQGNAMNTNVNNGGDGSMTVNLRSLGTNRTLVLLNGRRVVHGGGQVDLGALGDAVDLSSLPAAAVERIEIVKDGASALYGSDAIGGVVNIITRKSLNGTEAAAYAGTTGHGDGSTYDVSLTTGQSGERGNVLFSVGYYKVGQVMAGDRDYSKRPLEYVYSTRTTRYAGSNTPEPGRLEIQAPVVDCTMAGITPTLAALCAALPHDTDNPNMLAPVNLIRDPAAPGGWRPMVRADRYNFAPLNYLTVPVQRVSLFSTGDLALGNVGRGYFEASYVTRQSTTNGAPEPLLTDTATGIGATVSAQNQFNPFGVDLTPDVFNLRRRLSEFGLREVKQETSTFRVVTGLDGTLPEAAGPLKHWFWDLSLNFGRTQASAQKSGNLDTARLRNAMGPSHNFGTAAAPDWGCVDSGGARIPGCVPVNLFGGYDPANPTITPAMIDYLTFSGNGRAQQQMTAFQVNTSGELFRLLGDRSAALAVGYERRRESGASIPETLTSLGETTGNRAKATQGAFTVDEGYAELSLPFINNVPGAEDLELTGAVRFFRYDTFGSDSTYKVGGRWRPVRDVTLRGTWSTAFRAPSISDLFSGAADSFNGVSDPCAGNPAGPGSEGWIDPNSPQGRACGAAINNGDQNTQLRSTVGGNPNLKPETAKVFTMGVVLEPRWVRGLSLTVDYYHAKIDNAITTLGEQLILDSCYPTSDGRAPMYCDRIIRGASGRISNIENRALNVGGQEVGTLDIAARYGLPTSLGRFTGVFDGAWLLRFGRTLGDGKVTNERGNFDNGNNPTFKFNAGLFWALQGWSAGVTTRYMGHLRECSSAITGTSSGGICDVNGANNPDRRQVKVFNTYDLQAGYAFSTAAGKTSLGVGIQNVFDSDPPFIYSAFANNTDSDYSLIGRFFYVRLAHSY